MEPTSLAGSSRRMVVHPVDKPPTSRSSSNEELRQIKTLAQDLDRQQKTSRRTQNNTATPGVERPPIPSKKYGLRKTSRSLSNSSRTNSTGRDTRQTTGLRNFPTNKFGSSISSSSGRGDEPEIEVGAVAVRAPSREEPNIVVPATSEPTNTYNAPQDEPCLVEATLVEELPKGEADDSVVLVEAAEVTMKDIFQVKGVCCLFGSMIGCFLLVLISLIVALVLVTGQTSVADEGMSAETIFDIDPTMPVAAPTLPPVEYPIIFVDEEEDEAEDEEEEGPSVATLGPTAQVFLQDFGDTFVPAPSVAPEDIAALPPWQDPSNNQDPECSLDGGEFFSCRSTSVIVTAEDDVTFFAHQVSCPFDESIGMDFQATPSSCSCSVEVTQENHVRECACAVCTYGRGSSFAVDCSMVHDNPFIVGPCSSLDCDGRCNGTGVAVISQPTEGSGEKEGFVPAPATDGSGSGDNTKVIVVLIVVVALAMVLSVPLFVYFMKQRLQLEQKDLGARKKPMSP